MALVLVYMLMAAQFERFLDPLIVMLSVPMALIGVVPTLLLTGTTLNIQSVMGLVMLIGIVVNNAIVLVDAINLLRRERRMGAVDAVLEAGRLRLRPILMTTATTVLGLAPAGPRPRRRRRDPGGPGARRHRRPAGLDAGHPGADPGHLHDRHRRG